MGIGIAYIALKLRHVITEPLPSFQKHEKQTKPKPKTQKTKTKTTKDQSLVKVIGHGSSETRTKWNHSSFLSQRLKLKARDERIGEIRRETTGF